VFALGAVIVLLLGAGAWRLGPGRTSEPAGPVASGLASPEPTSGGDPTPTGIGGPGYLAQLGDLETRVSLADAGRQPYRAAVDDLLAWAADRVDDTPEPTARLRIRGTEGPFVDDTAAAYGLALAYVVSGDRSYGEAAWRFIEAWVDTMTATEGTCPDDGACQTSLIISRAAPGFVFAIDLLSGSGIIPAEDEARIDRWLRDRVLPTASELDNNWGDAGTFMRVVLTDHLGDSEGFAAAIDKWRSLMDLVAEDGHIPAEVDRGRAGLGYTQEALDYKVAVAVIAERRGIDLWSYEGARGGSLKGAFDYLARYMTDKSGWPWSERVRRRPPSPVWELAYQHWREPSYEAIVQERRPFGALGHSAVRWTTLTNGEPFDGG
jgi:hypothetical protein